VAFRCAQKTAGQAYQPVKQISHASPATKGGDTSTMVMAALQRSLGSERQAQQQQQQQQEQAAKEKRVNIAPQPKSHMAPRPKVNYGREMTQSPGRGRRYDSRHQLVTAPMQRGGVERARSPGIRYNQDPWKAAKQDARERKRQGVSSPGRLGASRETSLKSNLSQFYKRRDGPRDPDLLNDIMEQKRIEAEVEAKYGRMSTMPPHLKASVLAKISEEEKKACLASMTAAQIREVVALLPPEQPAAAPNGGADAPGTRFATPPPERIVGNPERAADGLPQAGGAGSVYHQLISLPEGKLFVSRLGESGAVPTEQPKEPRRAKPATGPRPQGHARVVEDSQGNKHFISSRELLPHNFPQQAGMVLMHSTRLLLQTRRRKRRLQRPRD